MKAWADVSASPEFLRLAPEDKEAARQQYFQQVVAPRVPAEEVDAARAQFDGATRAAPVAAAPPEPTVGGSVMSSIKSAAATVAGVVSDIGSGAKTLAGDVASKAASALPALARSGENADSPFSTSVLGAPPPPTPEIDKLDGLPVSAAAHDPRNQPEMQFRGVDQAAARRADWDTIPQGTLRAGYNAAAGRAGKTVGHLIGAAGELTDSVDLRNMGRQYLSAADRRIDSAMHGNEDSDSVKTVAGVFGLAPLLAGAGPGVVSMVTQAGVDGYGDSRQAGHTPSEAIARGTAMALANYLGMRVQVPGLTKALSAAVAKAPAGEAVAALGHALTTNAGGMEATTVLSDLYDKMAPGGLRPDMTLADMVHDIADTAKSATFLTLAVPGVPMGAAHLYGAAHSLAHGRGATDLARAIDGSAAPAARDAAAAPESAAAAPPRGAADVSTLTADPNWAAPIGLDTLHDTIDETASKIGLMPKAAAALREAVAKMDPQDAAAFTARAFHRFEANGLTRKAGAPGAFRDALNQRVVDLQPEQPVTKPESAPAPADAEISKLGNSESSGADDYSGLADAAPITPEAMAKANDIAAAAHQAATSPFNERAEPTDAQKQAGNYAMGHVQLHGLDVTIENPAGSTRSGVSPDGTAWRNEMQSHYGYIKGTHAVDGDHVDVFIGPNPESKTAFVIDQVDPNTGKFDEPKTILGADSEAQARQLYAANYADGWNGAGAVTALPMDAFKAWVRDGVKSKPLGDISQWKPTDERAQPDVAKPPDLAPGAGDGAGGPAVAGGGDSRPDSAVAAGRDLGGDAVAPADGARAAGAVGDGSAPDAALTPVPRLLGKPVTDHTAAALRKVAASASASTSQRARDVANAEITRRAGARSTPRDDVAPTAPEPQMQQASGGARGTAKHPATVMGSRLLSLVSKNLGGLDPAWLGEFSSKQETKRIGADGRPVTQWKNPLIPGVGKLFRRGGTQDLEELARVLEEHHYLAPGTVGRDAHAAGQQAQEIIRAALNRVEAKTIDEQQADDQAARNAEADAHYAALDADSAREAEAERAAIMSEHEFTADDAAALHDDDIDWFTGRSTKEIRDGIAQAADQPGAEAGAGQAGQDAGEGTRSVPEAGSPAKEHRSEGADEGLSLEAQSPADLKAKAAREDVARAADAAEQKRLRDKASADAQVGDFKLTGSDRPADEAAANGQAPLLSQHTEPFYSHLERSLTGLNMKAGDAGGWRQALKGLQGKGVKAEEIAWSGIDDWLGMQTGKVSKQEVLDYLANNGVKVTETMLSQEHAEKLPAGWEVSERGTGFAVYDERGNRMGVGDTRQEAIADAQDPDEQGSDSLASKYGRYTLAGGENYRELLLTLPEKDTITERKVQVPMGWGDTEGGNVGVERDGDNGRDYRSSHWNQPNVLAHIRFNDRTDAEGKKVLFIEEVQSDWGQSMKKMLDAADPGTPRDVALARAEKNGTPNGPFIGKTDAWLSLAIKRMAKYAVDHGYDRVAFTNGEQNAQRYDLSKSISRIELHDNTSGGIGRPSMTGPFERGLVRAYDLEGRRVIDRHASSPSELEDMIGKEAAGKLLASEPREVRTAGLGARERSLDGLDLKVGGEGMKSFYDKIVPSVAKDVVRKLGGDGIVPIKMHEAAGKYSVDPGPGEVVKHFDTRAEAEAFAAAQGEGPDFVIDQSRRAATTVGDQLGFDITDKMRATAADGVPLFKQSGDKVPTKGVDPVALRSEVGRIQAGWKDAPPVHVVDDVAGLPRHIQDSLRSMGAEGKTRALLMPGRGSDPGDVYLIANRLHDLPMAQFALFHEVLGHFGIRKVLGSDAVYAAEMFKLRQANPALAKEAEAWFQAHGRGAIADRMSRGLSMEAAMKAVRALSTEEALSDRAGRGEAIRGLQRLMAKVQEWLRHIGLHSVADRLEAMTEAETASLLARARATVEATEPSTYHGDEFAPALSETDDAGGPLLSQHTPLEEEALARAGIGGKQPFRARVKVAYGKMVDAIQNRGPLATEAGHQLRQGALDQFHGINRAVRREWGNLPVEQDPYITARLANGGTSSVMRALLLHGQARWSANKQHLEKVEDTKGLLDVLAPLGDDLNDFFGWMIGNRAARLKAEGRENNFTPDQIKALQGLANTTPEKLQAFRTAAKEYAAFKKSVLDVAEDAGLINPDARQAWDNADYIPFYRQIDDKATFGATGKKGLSGQSSGVRTLKGGSAALNDPMENLLMNFSRLIDASLKNNALRKTIDTLAGKTDVLEPVGYDMAGEVIPAGQIKKMLVEAGASNAALNAMPAGVFDGMAKMWAIKPPADPDIVRVMVDGKSTYYKVHDGLLLKALTSFVPFDFPGLGVARAFKRTLTGAITAAPEFMARNFIRDTVASAMISRDGIHPGKSMAGMVTAYREKGGFEKMLFAGASFQSGNINGADPKGTAKAMRRALRERGMDASSANHFVSTIVDTPARVWEMYRHIGEAVENANREAVFSAAKKGGRSDTAAAYEAKDLMDFSLRGSSPVYQLAADVLPFFNARMQGQYRLGRTSPKRLLAYGALMTAASVGLAMHNAGEDWYEELPDWDKDSYWHFSVGGKHFRLPKPFELGVVFATIPERILRFARGQDVGSKFAGRLWANARDQLAIDPRPQIVRPLVDVMNNSNSFQNTPINGMRDEGKLPSQRFSATTSDTARVAVGAVAPLADKAGVSPKDVEYLVSGYLGTAGIYALGLSDMAVRKLEGHAPMPTTRIDDLPMVKSFYREEPARATVYESDLYNLRTQVGQIYNSVKALNADEMPDAAVAMAMKHEKELGVRAAVEHAAKQLSALNKQRDAIYADRTMTPDTKRKLIDTILAQKAVVAKSIMTEPAVKAAQ